jgi:hypothetical protein
MEHVKAVTAMPLLVPPAEYVIADETARFGPVAARIAELVLARDFGSEELTQLLVAAQILLHRTRSAGGPADTTAAMDALLAQDVGAKMFPPCTEALYSVDACHDMTTEARTIVYSSSMRCMSHPRRQACTSRPAVAGARGPADGPGGGGERAARQGGRAAGASVQCHTSVMSGASGA